MENNPEASPLAHIKKKELWEKWEKADKTGYGKLTPFEISRELERRNQKNPSPHKQRPIRGEGLSTIQPVSEPSIGKKPPKTRGATRNPIDGSRVMMHINRRGAVIASNRR